MQIKTSDGGTSNVASQGLGVWGAVGGGLGTLALLTQNGGFGNIFGGGNNDTRTISALESKIAKLESERYTDGIGIELYKEIIKESNANDNKIQANFIELSKAVADLDKRAAVERQQTVDNFAFLNNRIDNCKQEVMCYVNATFVPGKLVMPLDSICPPAEPATKTPTTGA